jgi:hypothetical protein
LLLHDALTPGAFFAWIAVPELVAIRTARQTALVGVSAVLGCRARTAARGPSSFAQPNAVKLYAINPIFRRFMRDPVNVFNALLP